MEYEVELGVMLFDGASGSLVGVSCLKRVAIASGLMALVT